MNRKIFELSRVVRRSSLADLDAKKEERAKREGKRKREEYSGVATQNRKGFPLPLVTDVQQIRSIRPGRKDFNKKRNGD